MHTKTTRENYYLILLVDLKLYCFVYIFFVLFKFKRSLNRPPAWGAWSTPGD